MLKIEDVKNTHLVVATPCYGGQVFQNYFMSILKLVFTASRVGLPISFIIRGGDSLIPRTRNSIVAEFMATPQYTHLLWVDADVGFEPDAVLRLLMADRDVVCGVYPLKKIVWPEGGFPADMTREQFEATYTHYPFNPFPGRPQEIDSEGFMEVMDAPTGLMMVKKEVFNKMAKAYPGLRYVADEMLGLETIKDLMKDFHFRFFDVMTEENGRYLSEDYSFCRRWQKLGGKVFIDCHSKLSHQGGHLYTSDLFKSLTCHNKQHGIVSSVAMPTPEQAVRHPEQNTLVQAVPEVEAKSQNG